MWTAQRFGTWPPVIGSIDGSNNMELSIRVNYDAGGTRGSNTIGTTSDFGDPANINGSRIVTGNDLGRVTSISAYVAAPLDVAPFNQFEMAIYDDHHGAPGRLLANSPRGRLTADAWNTVPLVVPLAPHTPYWLFYNSNGRTDSLNNLTFTPVVADPLDSVIRAPRSGGAGHFADALSLVGSPLAGVIVTLGLSLWIGRETPHAAWLLGAGLAVGTLSEFILKQTLFFPYSTYPSGHALRATFLATVITVVASRRSVRWAVAVLAVIVSLGAVHQNRHYSEEVVGGALAGWTLASAVVAFAAAVERPDLPSPRMSPAGAFSQGTGLDRRRRERRRRTEPIEAH